MIYAGKVELGTGVATALLRIVADGLGVRTDHVSLAHEDTALTPDQGPRITVSASKRAACSSVGRGDAASRVTAARSSRE
ncbi:MAG: molybdopterin-dependent oxidoreductase [Acetobacteraceae bacterium]|nr:molybdopterin-dependent oxidoreductase [Acetobacteraceae bacterium]